MIYGIGTDIADIERVRKILDKHGDHFAGNILSAKEMEVFKQRGGKAEFIAGRWAAKEAFSKALGTGIGEFCSFKEIEILPDDLACPVITALYGRTEKAVREKRIAKYHVSISHERDYAVAFVVLESE